MANKRHSVSEIIVPSGVLCGDPPQRLIDYLHVYGNGRVVGHPPPDTSIVKEKHPRYPLVFRTLKDAAHAMHVDVDDVNSWTRHQTTASVAPCGECMLFNTHLPSCKQRKEANATMPGEALAPLVPDPRASSDGEDMPPEDGDTSDPWENVRARDIGPADSLDALVGSDADFDAFLTDSIREVKEARAAEKPPVLPPLLIDDDDLEQGYGLTAELVAPQEPCRRGVPLDDAPIREGDTGLTWTDDEG